MRTQVNREKSRTGRHLAKALAKNKLSRDEAVVWNRNLRSGREAMAHHGRADDSMSKPTWKTTVEMARRYQLSIRTIAYLVADGVLPVYKVGRAVRFDPLECDHAMKAFRRASQFDD